MIDPRTSICAQCGRPLMFGVLLTAAEVRLECTCYMGQAERNAYHNEGPRTPEPWPPCEEK